MKKTRNLIVLLGAHQDVGLVLGELQYKGLVTVNPGIHVTKDIVTNAFRCNKSLVCSGDDIVVEDIGEEAIFINVKNSLSPEPLAVRGPIILSNLANVETQFEQIMDALNCDIGDHRSNSSGLNGTPTIEDCVYCRYLAGDVGPNAPTFYSSKNFFSFPGTGQFLNGYVLIMPRQHVMSNAELSQDLLEEFQQVASDIEYILKLTYGCDKILMWENGSGNSGIGKAKDSIVHSHVHMAPSNLSSDDIRKISGFPFERITLKELHLFKEHSYLAVQEDDGEHWIINNDPMLYIPRQYMRQILAEELGLQGDLWNWRTYPFRTKLFQTVEDIHAALDANWETLPERIRKNCSCFVVK